MADALVEVAGEKLPLFNTYSEEDLSPMLIPAFPFAPGIRNRIPFDDGPPELWRRSLREGLQEGFGAAKAEAVGWETNESAFRCGLGYK
jgi:hypothetical protein